MTYQPIQLTESQCQQFQDDGFLIIENFLPSDLTQAIIERSEPIFAGEFETGIYPDEWHWRPGLSRPDIIALRNYLRTPKGLQFRASNNSIS